MDFASLLTRAASNDLSLVELVIGWFTPDIPENRAELVQRVVAALAKNTHVTSLNFSALRLTEADIAPLAELLKTRNLERLSLESNLLSSEILLPALAERNSLRVLSLSSNKSLAGLQHLSALISLNELDLSRCGLTNVPPALTQLAHLEVLKLSGNPIAKIPDSISGLANLKVFVASNCALTEIQVGTAQLHAGLWALMNLEQSSNPLRALPGGIGALKKLKKLSLSGSKLIRLPSEIQMLRVSLDRLEIDRTNITHLPLWLASLPLLKELDCTSCPLVGFAVEENTLLTFGELLRSLLSESGHTAEGQQIQSDFELLSLFDPFLLLRIANMHFAPRTPLRVRCVSKCVAQHSALELERLPAHIRDELVRAAGVGEQ